MATKKIKYPTHISPAGTAVYPWLNKADTKFDADGVFSVKLIFSKEDAKKVSDIVKPIMNGGKNNPIKPHMDDQGDKTGNYIVNFKMKAHVKTKAGDEWDQSPIILDTDGNRVMEKVGGGSLLKVAYQAVPFDAMGGGVSLRLVKVQVQTLVEYKSEGDNVDFGKPSGDFKTEKKDVVEEFLEDVELEGEDEEDF
jgi:hypothetical protein